MRLKTASGNSETVLRSLLFPLRDNFRFLCKATVAATPRDVVPRSHAILKRNPMIIIMQTNAVRISPCTGRLFTSIQLTNCVLLHSAFIVFPWKINRSKNRNKLLIVYNIIVCDRANYHRTLHNSFQSNHAILYTVWTVYISNINNTHL